MDSFEVLVNDQNYRIVRNTTRDCIFNVFNHAMCHVIKKKENGILVAIQHRFGAEHLPLVEIGYAIDNYYRKNVFNEIL